jgi:hypothetical protein
MKTACVDPNYLFLSTSHRALEIAFKGGVRVDNLAVEISLRDGLAMISWVRLGTDKVESVAGMTISDY